jgi:hypothetical protein
MNNLTKILLGGVAISALASAPAIAAPKHPAMHVTALHGGKAVNKSKMHNPSRTHITYTFGVYTYQSASGGKVKLGATYYKWNSYSSLCTTPAMRITTPRKSVYAKIGHSTETYSFGCPSGPTVFYGDTWKNLTGVSGNTDTFVSTLTGKFKNSRGKYFGTLNLDVNVFIQ